MKVLFLGDIVGKKGREVIRDFLPSLKEKYKADIVIANGENAAHGKGITYKLYNEILSYGVDVITMGNHTFSKKEIIDYLDVMPKLICPINHISKQGKGYRVFNVNKESICIINVLGLFVQEEYATSPYQQINKVLDSLKNKNVDYILVDMHGEATAEKRLFVEYYKNKVTAVLGTHTHVQTADERIIGNAGFISDVGMCGPYDSIIGRDINECIKKMINNEETRYTIADSEPMLNGVYLELTNKRCTHIERIRILPY